MAIKFQYNKTSLGDLGKQLKMRQKALPTIKSKESALRGQESEGGRTGVPVAALAPRGRVRLHGLAVG